MAQPKLSPQVAGAALAAALIKQTVNTGEAPASYDKGVETAALKSMHGTSTMNRITRLGLGSVYYYSAITTYQRLVGQAGSSYWPQFADSASALVQKGDYLSAGQVFGVEAAKAGSVLLLVRDRPPPCSFSVVSGSLRIFCCVYTIAALHRGYLALFRLPRPMRQVRRRQTGVESGRSPLARDAQGADRTVQGS